MAIFLLQNFVSGAFEDGDHVLRVHLDLGKTFDTVHLKLSYASKNGIKGNRFDILSSYLLKIKQCVKMRNENSTLTNAIIRAPQRSILGPLMFLI